VGLDDKIDDAGEEEGCVEVEMDDGN